jgi:uncharacterized protein YndB with AHSA1/START domain
MAQYTFMTRWRFEAPIEQVWEAIRDYRAWPNWWPAIAKADQVQAGDVEGCGEVVDFLFRTRLPYSLGFRMTTTMVERPHRLEGMATGQLEGTGRWELREAQGATGVVYYWEVTTTRWWMQLLAPVARPLFTWNHDQVMQSGERGLRRLLRSRRRTPFETVSC